MLLPTHPKQALPQKIIAFLRIFIFVFRFSLILLTNSSLKSVKAVFFLIEERLHRLLLYAFLPYTASISSCVLGAQKNPHRDGSFEYPKYLLWPRNEKMRENLSSKFPKRASSATVTSENLNIFKTSPLFGVVRQNFISVQLRDCAGSSEPYLLQLCYIIRCPMWGEGKRVGERRGSISGFNW